MSTKKRYRKMCAFSGGERRPRFLSALLMNVMPGSWPRLALPNLRPQVLLQKSFIFGMENTSAGYEGRVPYGGFYIRRCQENFFSPEAEERDSRHGAPFARMIVCVNDSNHNKFTGRVARPFDFEN